MGHLRKKKLSDGTFAYMLVVEDGLNVNGKRKQRTKTLHHVTKKEALKQLYKFEIEVKEGTYIEKTDTTLKDYMENWLELYKKNKLSPTTYAGYQQKLYTHICSKKYGIGHMAIQKIRTDDVQRFINRMIEGSSATGNPLSAKTILEVHKLARTALNKAVREGLIARNPADDTELPTRRKKEIAVFSYDEIKKLLHELRETENDLEMPVNLALSLGMRRGEVLGLKYADVDFEKKTIRIHNNRVQCNGRSFDKEPKTRNSIRTVNIPNGLLELSKTEYRKLKKVQFQRPGYNKENYVCYKRLTGTPWEPDNLTRKYTNFVKRMGLPRVTFHGLRHSYASICVDKNVGISDVSHMLGHASTSFTYDTYTHPMQNRGKTIANIMDSTLYAQEN